VKESDMKCKKNRHNVKTKLILGHKSDTVHC